jgi:vacuolar-type H+-ATPase subunit C/Vma6
MSLLERTCEHKKIELKTEIKHYLNQALHSCNESIKSQKKQQINFIESLYEKNSVFSDLSLRQILEKFLDSEIEVENLKRRIKALVDIEIEILGEHNDK